jgi:peptidylprolyl isomerase
MPTRSAARLLLACGLLAAPVPLHAEDAAVGRAGGVAVSAAEVRAAVAGLPEPARRAMAADPAQAAQWLRGQLLDRLVAADAVKSGFADRPDVADRIARARAALLIELYLESKVAVAADWPSEAEARTFYDANTAAFVPPKRYRLAQIFVADATGAAPSPKLDAVLARLKLKGADFATIARQVSDAKAEAEKGGEIGWLGEPALAPEIRAAIATAKKDAVTAPIRLADGWHIVKVLDLAPAGSAPLAFEQVKPTLAAEMRRRKVAADKQAFIEALLKADPPIVDEMGLAEALKAK